MTVSKVTTTLASIAQTCENVHSEPHCDKISLSVCVQSNKQTVNCSRFHIWDEELKQCSQIDNTTVVSTPEHEEHDSTSKKIYLQDQHR
jgi:hypothetical protein